MYESVGVDFDKLFRKLVHGRMFAIELTRIGSNHSNFTNRVVRRNWLIFYRIPRILISVIREIRGGKIMIELTRIRANYSDYTNLAENTRLI
jgi:hypothetical protein